MKNIVISLVCMMSINISYSQSINTVDLPDTSEKNDHYISNGAPLIASPLVKLPVGSIRPEGWLRNQLRLQAEGFHGHLTEISGFLKKEDNAWLNKDGIGSRGWEEVPYWLKGFSNTAYVLDDKEMIKEAQVWIEGALNSQKADGWFGPDGDRSGLATGLKGRDDLWPNMIMMFCLQDYYEFTGDKRVITLMTNYMKYLAKVPEDKFINGYWPKMRAADQVYSILWLYNRIGGQWLLDLAHKTHRCTARWDEDIINWHNVNISQAFGGPTTYYQLSKHPLHLNASERNWQKIREMYGQVPGGMFGSDENCRVGYTDPRQAVETCGMVEMMLSHETLLQITGNLIWADRCEDVAFNSLPAATTADMKALRYLTSPNMVLSDSKNKSPGIQNGGPMFHMNPHDHRCCQHNMGHGWPYFAEHLWMATPDNGIAAVIYSASQVRAKVGDGTEVVIGEKTLYPFDGLVSFRIQTPRAVQFPLYLRIPGWCNNASVIVEGKNKAISKPGSFVMIDRKWNNGDNVLLKMDMDISVRKWEKNKGSVSIDRGPLTYSLKIKEKYVKQGGSEKWPAWEIYPDSAWNYGLVLDGLKDFKVIKKKWPESNQPFDAANCPIEITAKAKKIPQWKMDHLGLVDQLQQSPVYSDQPVETVELIPMGAARLRISSFPVIGDGPDATRWKAPKIPKKMASHCFGADTVEALWDGKIPANSNDHSIRRFTWWDHKGTSEWVQYDLDEAKEISSVSVYWFDDTGRGECRLPKSWKVVYRDGDKYKPVNKPDNYPVELDKFNTVTFDSIKTDSIRIEVQLQQDVSGGILEVQVK